ncbi:MAG: SGNH/GDSL hydrolase family protein [Ferruginibacter sp.]
MNLGFSGNGRLEKEVIGLLTGMDAKLYVLDCLPNLVGGIVSLTELKNRITTSVIQLRKSKPAVPILLTEHDGYTDEAINAVSKKEYQEVNIALKEVFDSLSAAGISNIYLLSKNEIGQDIESMVDGVHPNDIGMMRYADAYEKKIKAILHEPVTMAGTTLPVTQRRDANIYDWETRHNEVMSFNKAHAPELVLIGNSITHYWAGQPAAPIARGETSWKKYFEKMNPVNMGFGWDRIENVLWRIYHGELDSISPKHIVLMIVPIISAKIRMKK